MSNFFMPNRRLIDRVSMKKKTPGGKDEICLICQEKIRMRQKRIYLTDGRVYHYECFVKEIFEWELTKN